MILPMLSPEASSIRWVLVTDPPKGLHMRDFTRVKRSLQALAGPTFYRNRLAAITANSNQLYFEPTLTCLNQGMTKC